MSHSESHPLVSSQYTRQSFIPALVRNSPSSLTPIVEARQSSYSSIPWRYDTKPSQAQGFISSPLLVAVALIVGLVLIFGIIYEGGSGKENNTAVLKQSASFVDTPTAQGVLRGYVKKSRQGRDYTAYYKVPYAEPPVGQMRFKDPVSPKTTWSGIRDISEVAPQCIQKEKYSDIDIAVGEEDCLYANIYVPSIATVNASLPVMVYIHGGGLTDGNGSRYGADYFMDEDIILITFQYRLGPFGFLQTSDGLISGNMGFKDQVQMLIWTRDNIRDFGGDSDTVTIFGNSAGASSVSFLMLSPLAKGLFHRSITQSGASVCAGPEGFLDYDPTTTLKEVGKTLNCDTSDTLKFLDCMRTKDAHDVALVRTENTFYSLTIDKDFMPDLPYNILGTNPNQVPSIIGVVNSEWTVRGLTLLLNPDLVNNMNNDFGQYANQVIKLNLTSSELLKIKEFYFGKSEIGNSTLREVINMISDAGMIYCSYTSAKMHAKFSPTYLYWVNKPPAKSYADKILKGFPAKELGMVAHADELQYMFLYDGYPEISTGDPEYFQFSKDVVHLWATFAKDGAPSSDWQPQINNSSFWFELNDTFRRTNVPDERMQFWEQFSDEQLGFVPSK